MSTLTDYLLQNGCKITEGHCGQIAKQREDLVQITSRPNIRVMEIGFNAGHSAETFLKHNPTLSLVSFDIGHHGYLRAGKNYIDVNYPGRHTLIIGDSTKTVPEYISSNPAAKFDIIFIDGGHDYPISRADMDNSIKLAHSDTVIIMDDTIYTPGWSANYTEGPTKVWEEYEQNGWIKTIAKRDYEFGRGMSWGTMN